MKRLSNVLADPRWGALLGAAVIWWIVFPEDFGAVLGPLRELLELGSEVLQLTNSVSPYAYLLVAVGLVCWTYQNRATHLEQHSRERQ